MNIETHTYQIFLNAVKDSIQSAGIKASQSVNRAMIDLYWQIGQMIVEKQDALGWGKSVVEKLSKDLKDEFPNQKGYSVQNLWFMRQFYMTYQDFLILYQAAREIPWMHNVLIMTKIKDRKEQEFYLKASAKFGWSRNILLHQIKANAYKTLRVDTKVHNFKETLSQNLAEQAQEALKSEYSLDFLGLNARVKEREIENHLLQHIKEFLLEMGYGFAFLGNQYKIKLGENEYWIDLLFYHRGLQCLVALELKITKFIPEYAGKMNFYLEILDDVVKMPHENPSIGIILCAEKDNLEVEYTLRSQKRPIGVSEYKLYTELPNELSSQLPSPKDIKNYLKSKKNS